MPIDVNGNIIEAADVYSDGEHIRRITQNGLYLHLDAGNAESYPGTGTDWYDLSGYGNDAELFGTIVWGTVSGATAFTHSVAGRYASGSTIGNEGATLECTIETWVALSGSEIAGGTTDRGNIVLQSGASTQSGIYHSYNRTSYKQSNYWYRHLPQGYHESGAAISKQRWHQIVGVWDNKNMYQWIDGTLTSVDNVVNSNDTTYTNPNFFIGSQGLTSGRHFAGYMAIVRLYNRALHPYEIGENFQAERGRFSI